MWGLGGGSGGGIDRVEAVLGIVGAIPVADVSHWQREIRDRGDDARRMVDGDGTWFRI